MNEQEQMKEFLQKSLGRVDAELKRDLWPRMLRRMDTEQSPVSVPWFDWALAGALVIWLLVLPGTIPALLYHL